MSNLTYAWAPITKSEKQDDGTLLVYGPAASSALDRDQQRLDAAWLDQAMPRWLADGGGVREQHDPKKAVGVGVGLSKGDDGAHLLTARIVDPVAVKKIEYGVLKGFSVGIKNPRIEMGKTDAPNGLVTAGDVIEVSVVDRPANGECLFELAKADAAGELVLVEDPHVVEKTETFGLLPELFDRLAAPVKDALAALATSGAQVAAELGKADGPEPVPVVVNVVVKADAPDLAKDYSAAEKREALKNGQAMENDTGEPAYTIKSKADLRKAIKAVGRGGAEHDDIRKHVITRAKALNLEAMVPKNWNPDGSLKDADVAKSILADLEKLGLTAVLLAKADDADGDGEQEQPDIDGATAAIAAIAALIISEAESLAKGNLNEACDIALLLQAVEALKWFSCREAAEDDDGADMALSDDADLTKAGKKGNLAPPFKKKDSDEDDAEDGDDPEDDDEDDEAKKPAPKAKKSATKSDDGELLTKADAQAAIKAAVAEALAATASTTETSPAETPESVTKADLADMVETAVAEARKADEERIDALTADLAKAAGDLETIKATPIPGGPVLMRTANQQGMATKSDADVLRAQANELLAKANTFSSNRDLAAGYRERANALLAKADA